MKQSRFCHAYIILCLFSPTEKLACFKIWFTLGSTWKLLPLPQTAEAISNKLFSLGPQCGSGTLRHIIIIIIIHQTHYQKSDWSRAFNQFTIACELDMINAISAADIAFIMSSSTSAWLLSPLECSPQKQNG